MRIVKHEDFIPKEFLPVFNSTAIEVHLHRIPGLSDNFVYFNDDMYLMKHCKPTDFFRKGKPVDMASFSPVPPNFGGEIYFFHLYNDYSIYKNYFSRRTLFKHFFRYVNIRYGNILVKNMLNIASKNLFLHEFHFAKPFKK